jgi:hypothetical protein
MVWREGRESTREGESGTERKWKGREREREREKEREKKKRKEAERPRSFCTSKKPQGRVSAVMRKTNSPIPGTSPGTWNGVWAQPS